MVTTCALSTASHDFVHNLSVHLCECVCARILTEWISFSLFIMVWASLCLLQLEATSYVYIWTTVRHHVSAVLVAMNFMAKCAEWHTLAHCHYINIRNSVYSIRVHSQAQCSTLPSIHPNRMINKTEQGRVCLWAKRTLMCIKIIIIHATVSPPTH